MTVKSLGKNLRFDLDNLSRTIFEECKSMKIKYFDHILYEMFSLKNNALPMRLGIYFIVRDAFLRKTI